MWNFLRISLFFLAGISNAQINQCNKTWFEGEGTFYGGVAGGKGGHCGLQVEPGDIFHVAMNHMQYAKSEACGACVRVLGPKGQAILKVVDECPECKFGDLDVAEGVFPYLADVKDGRIKIKWQYVPCPIAGNIQFLFSEGSGPYYFKAQILDARYSVKKLEYKRIDGSFDSIPRVVYNYFVKEGGIDENKLIAGPYTFRLTSFTGEMLLIQNVFFSTSKIVSTGGQFTALQCPDCAGTVDGTAQIDNCGICSGGTTGIVPNSTCRKDCAGYWEGTAYLDDCERCVAGTTGLTPCGKDCLGSPGGLAYTDNCGRCVGGLSGLKPCKKDCDNNWGGEAFQDSCGQCSGGNTGIVPILKSSLCVLSTAENVEMNDRLQLFPNPTNGLFFVKMPSAAFRIQLKDVYGQKLLDGHYFEGATLDLQGCPAGIYFLELYMDGAKMTRKVLLK